MNPNNKASTSTFENSNLDGSALDEDKNGSDSDSSDAEELVVEAEVIVMTTIMTFNFFLFSNIIPPIFTMFTMLKYYVPYHENN